GAEDSPIDPGPIPQEILQQEAALKNPFLRDQPQFIQDYYAQGLYPDAFAPDGDAWNGAVFNNGNPPAVHWDPEALGGMGGFVWNDIRGNAAGPDGNPLPPAGP